MGSEKQASCVLAPCKLTIAHFANVSKKLGKGYSRYTPNAFQIIDLLVDVQI
jgi:hypothetical protein